MHYVVEHKKAFSCQCRDETGQLKTTHTNRIEGAWKHSLEYFGRMKGTKVSQFESHLCNVEMVGSDTQGRGNIAADKGVLHSDRTTSIHNGMSAFQAWSRQSTDSMDD